MVRFLKLIIGKHLAQLEIKSNQIKQNKIKMIGQNVLLNYFVADALHFCYTFKGCTIISHKRMHQYLYFHEMYNYYYLLLLVFNLMLTFPNFTSQLMSTMQ